jgi:hypothetical protein
MNALAGTAYTAAQYEENYPPGSEQYFWHVARLLAIRRAVRSIAATGPKKILEIGCGRGIVVRYLREQGIDCSGVELSDAVEIAPDLAPFIHAGRDCFDLPVCVRERSDCLMLLDVIEHLPNPITFMVKLRAAFPRARCLVVTVPARSELWSNYDDHFGHFRRYTRQSLWIELGLSGFSVIRSRYIFHSLYPVMLAAAKSTGKRFTQTPAPARPMLHRGIGLGFFVESLIVPPWVWGTSLICTARVAE